MRNLCILGGNSHPALTNSICKQLDIPVGKSTLTKFANNETNVYIDETVREVDTYIIQSGCGEINDNFMEMLIMISACKTSSARKITAVIPCFPYARQSENMYKSQAPMRERKPPKLFKKTKEVAFKAPQARLSSGDSDAVVTQLGDLGSPLYMHSSSSPINNSDQDKPKDLTCTTEKVESDSSPSSPNVHQRTRLSSISISQPNIQVTPLASSNKSSVYKSWSARPGTLICNMLVAAGCDHVITMDLHDPQFQGFFDIPVDNLFSSPLILKYIKDHYHDVINDVTIVSPDAGGAKRATTLADKLNANFALIHKERAHNGPRGSDMMLIGDVKDKFCIIIDDMADTADTIIAASQVLKDKGAKNVIAIITHGILSGNAITKINNSCLEQVICSNTVPQEENMKKSSKIKVMDVTIIFSEAIRRIHNGESVSFLADVVPY